MKYDLEAKFYSLKEEGRLTSEVVNDLLKKYQNELRTYQYDINIPIYTPSDKEKPEGVTHLFTSNGTRSGINTYSDLFKQDVQVKDLTTIENDYYIHPEVVYSSDEENITIEIPDTSYYREQIDMFCLNRKCDAELNSLLDEDQDAFNLFSQNFDETIYKENSRHVWNMDMLKHVLNNETPKKYIDEESLKEVTLKDGFVNTTQKSLSPSQRFKHVSYPKENSEFLQNVKDLETIVHQGKFEENKSFAGVESSQGCKNLERRESSSSLNESAFFKNEAKITSTPIGVNDVNDYNIFNDTNITEDLETLKATREVVNIISNVTLVPDPQTKTKKHKDCDIPTTSNVNIVQKKNKPKFKTPVKECDWEKYGIIRNYNKQKVLKEFDEQSKKLLDSCETNEDISNYVKYIENRPSVNQINQVTTVALIHKTNDGVVVLSPPSNTVQKKKRKPETTLNTPTYFNQFDVSFFSDRNSESFDKFLQNKDNIPIHEVCVPGFQRINKFKRQKIESFQENQFVNENYNEHNVTVLCNLPSTSKRYNRQEDKDSSEVEKLIKKYVPDPDAITVVNSTSESIFQETTFLLDS